MSFFGSSSTLCFLLFDIAGLFAAESRKEPRHRSPELLCKIAEFFCDFHCLHPKSRHNAVFSTSLSSSGQGHCPLKAETRAQIPLETPNLAGGSSNGRTAAFDSANPGSMPGPPANFLMVSDITALSSNGRILGSEPIGRGSTP